MKVLKTLWIIDLDGCIVKSFDGKGLNQAAFAEQIVKQPLNEKICKIIHEHIGNNTKKVSPWNVPYIITGRKQSLLKAITEKQVSFLGNLKVDIIYYPEEKGYDPFIDYVNWKVEKIFELIGIYPTIQKIIVIEDTIEILQEFNKRFESLSQGIKKEYWLVYKDQSILKVSDFIEPIS